jgi:hypothetical protein
MDRNQLVKVVIWPNGPDAQIHLHDASEDSVIVGEVHVKAPLMGSELARKVPPGYHLAVYDCTVVSMAGELLVTTEVEFDTVVVTERAEKTFEERFAELEMRERNRERREKQREERERQREEQYQRDLEELKAEYEQREGDGEAQDTDSPSDAEEVTEDET